MVLFFVVQQGLAKIALQILARKAVVGPAGYLSEFETLKKHTFSAFWLRSSVVSVLISLISDNALQEQRY